MSQGSRASSNEVNFADLNLSHEVIPQLTIKPTNSMAHILLILFAKHLRSFYWNYAVLLYCKLQVFNFYFTFRALVRRFNIPMLESEHKKGKL